MTAYRTALFTLADGDDASPTYQGYTDGRTWNGWASPLFSPEVALKVAQDVSEPEHPPVYDEVAGTIRIYMADCGEWDTFSCAHVDGIPWQWDEEVGDHARPANVYDFQQNGWCWEEVYDYDANLARLTAAMTGIRAIIKDSGSGGAIANMAAAETMLAAVTSENEHAMADLAVPTMEASKQRPTYCYQIVKLAALAAAATYDQASAYFDAAYNEVTAQTLDEIDQIITNWEG